MTVTRHIVFGLLLIVALALIAWLSGDLLDRHWIDVYVRDRGVQGELLFLGVATVLISIGLSRQFIAFLAGYGFGFGGGFLLSMAAVAGGCVITFCCSRLLLRDVLARQFSARIRRLDGFIRDHTFTATLLFRLLPVGSNWLVNIAAGISAVRGVPFLLGSLLGFIPQMLVFSLVGSGSQLQRFWQIALAMVLFVAAALLGVWLFARYRRYLGAEPGSGESLQERGLAGRR